jgi:hypothetical protein
LDLYGKIFSGLLDTMNEKYPRDHQGCTQILSARQYQKKKTIAFEELCSVLLIAAFLMDHPDLAGDYPAPERFY